MRVIFVLMMGYCIAYPSWQTMLTEGVNLNTVCAVSGIVELKMLMHQQELERLRDEIKKPEGIHYVIPEPDDS